MGIFAASDALLYNAMTDVDSIDAPPADVWQ